MIPKETQMKEQDKIKEEQIAKALMRLDQFTLQTSLPRPWHAEWMGVFKEVQTEICGILNQKDSNND